MEIKTKYNIGDLLYRVDMCNNISEIKIQKIVIYSDGIVYKDATDCHNEYEHDNNLFNTRAEAEEEAIKRFSEIIRMTK